MCKPGASLYIPVGSRIDRVRVNTHAKNPYIEATIIRCLPLVKEEGGARRNSAIHTTYRISLRSSSLREPRYPLLRVVLSLIKNRAEKATVFIRSENEGLNLGCMVGFTR
jgi:hypothetical protein